MALTKTDESPSRGSGAKLQVYEEPPTDFGLSPNKQSPGKKKRVIIDHLCMDVPSEQMLREIFQYFDKDNSGFLDAKEFRILFRETFENFGAPMEDKDVDRLFEQFDRAGGRKDGKLSFEEFSILMLNRLRQ